MKRIWIISLCFLLFGCGVVKESEKYKDLTKQEVLHVHSLEKDFDVETMKKDYEFKYNAFTTEAEKENYELHTIVYPKEATKEGMDELQFIIVLESDEEEFVKDTRILNVMWSDQFNVVNSSCFVFYEEIGYIAENNKLISSSEENIQFEINKKSNGKNMEYVVMIIDVEKEDELGTANLVAEYKKDINAHNLIIVDTYFEY